MTVPKLRERLEWSAMLTSVLTGDVVRQEKRRLSGAVLPKGSVDFSFQIWVHVRAVLHRRSVPEEIQRIEEMRADLEKVLDEVNRFEVSYAPNAKDPYDQVVGIMHKIDTAEALYPSRKAFRQDKPLFASSALQAKIAALTAWLSTTNSVRLQLALLTAWTCGSVSSLELNTTFIDRVLKESGVTGTFEIRQMRGLDELLLKSKRTMVENAPLFARIGLPTQIGELQTLASFPCRLMKEILRVQLSYAEKLNKYRGSTLHQLMDFFRASLNMAIRIKHSAVVLNEPAPGWTITNSVPSTYDQILLRGLHCYFELQKMSLRDNTESAFFKDAEMIETEWDIYRDQWVLVKGGDAEAAEQLCLLETLLMGKIHSYIESQLNPKQRYIYRMRYYSRMLESVKSRTRKTSRIIRALSIHLEQAADYALTGSYGDLLYSLMVTDHTLVRTTGYDGQNVLLFASPRVGKDPDIVERIVKNSLQSTKHDFDAGGDTSAVFAIQAKWTGSEMKGPRVSGFKKSYEIGLKRNRVRIVADSAAFLQSCRSLLENSIGTSSLNIVKASRPHMPAVYHAMQLMKRMMWRLGISMCKSIFQVCEITKHQGAMIDLVHEFFTFNAEYAWRIMRYISGNTQRRYLLGRLLRVASDWIGFCILDCPPHNPKTLKWCLSALEFTSTATEGRNIFAIEDREFAVLRLRVSRCMQLLMSHFGDGWGDAAQHETPVFAPQPRPSEPSLRGADRRLMDSHGASGVASGGGGSGNGGGDDASHDTPVVKARLAKIHALESDRHRRLQTGRLVGKALDASNAVDRNIGFLASSNSSISLRWQQGKFLGGGAVGSVYMGINLDTADVMAVKELRFQDVLKLDQLQKAIRDEMNVLQVLHHPYIVEYYGVEVHRDRMYIFMEYCPHSLSGLLDEHGRFRNEQIVRLYTKQMLTGLKYLHTHGIVHRDIKPANMLIGPTGIIKFADFGASKLYARSKTLTRTAGGAGGRTTDHSMGTLVGTPHYIAPEVITGEPVGKFGTQDVWSFGCCVLEMITGKKPWSDLDNEWAVMYHIGLGDKHPPLPVSDVSPEGIDFLQRCFTRPASARPSADELLSHPWL
ncbi:hypothetical protein CXG81DRAFT_13448, partial [Caulochytrium protostelioides]